MFFLLNQLDTSVTSAVVSLIPRSSLIDHFFSFWSVSFHALPIWIAVVILIMIFEEKHHHMFIVSCILAFGISGLLSNFVIKNIVQRPRPVVAINQTYQCPTDFSFPSSHAATAFATATVIVAFHKKKKWIFYALLYTVAVLISLSRIYLQCHFVGDIVFGAILGYLIGKLFSPK